MKVLWKKIDQMWSDYHFLILSKMTVQINATEFSVNSWETPRFSRTILHGSLAGSREYKQYRTKNNDNTKTTKQELVKNWSKNKADRIFFLRKGTFFASEAEGRGESNVICLSPADSQPFNLDKLTNSHPFCTQSTSPFSQDTPSSTSFFAKFIAYVTSGWKFDRTDQRALCFKIASDI